jgi:hypothetical protein
VLAAKVRPLSTGQVASQPAAPPQRRQQPAINYWHPQGNGPTKGTSQLPGAMTLSHGQGGDDQQRRSSTRASSVMPVTVAHSDLYQPNNGLNLTDDRSCVTLDSSSPAQSLPASSALPSSISVSDATSYVQSDDISIRQASIRAPEPSTAEKQRPCSTSKPPDHLTLRPSSPEGTGSTVLQRPHYDLTSDALPPGGPSRGPTHAYSLFQNSVEEPPDDVDVTPGMVSGGVGRGYRRQANSVSTEMMAPIGQTEDLPPYTRYPEDDYRQQPDLASTASLSQQTMTTAATAAAATLAPSPTTTSSGRRLTIQPLPPGAGGIGLATRNPEYDPSTDDLATPGFSPALRSPSAESQRAITAPVTGSNEKPSADGGWKRWARKRIGGIIPYWVVFTAAVAMLFMGVVLGTVIGVYLGKHGDRDRDDSGDTNSHTKPQPISGSDVVALSSLPDGLPSLDTGCYTLSPLITRNAPNDCFAIQSQDQAWSCNIPYAMYYLNIDRLSDQPNTANYMISLVTYDHRNNSGMPKYPWGAAPPVLNQPANMQLVLDTFESNQGPAWWARIPYNKTVIIGEDRIAPALRRRRSQVRLGRRGSSQVSNGDESDDDNRTGADQDFEDGVNLGAIEGDQPWICTWPNTILEVYIYPEQQSNDDHTAPSPRLAREVLLDYESESESEYESEYESGYESGYVTHPPTQLATPTTAVTTATTTVTSATSPGSSSWLPFEGVPAKPDIYPKVFKFKERRLPELGSSTATCRQVRIVNGGQGDTPVLDAFGQPVEITIDEISDDQTLSRRGKDDTINRLFSRGSAPAGAELTDCGCLWWVF